MIKPNDEQTIIINQQMLKIRQLHGRIRSLSLALIPKLEPFLTIGL